MKKSKGLNMSEKLSKVNSLLKIYEVLITGGVVNKGQAAHKLDVSTKTISRYIKELDYFLTKEKKQQPIKYSRKLGGYFLESEGNKILNKRDALAIAKVLLESRGFPKREITDLIEKLIASCQYDDKTFINKIIASELENYVEPKHQKELVNMIWDISYAIRHQKLLEIKYNKIADKGVISNNAVDRIIRPEGILFSEYYFYLTAFIEENHYQYPTIYRLDRIKEYKILKKNFKINYSSRFKDGEFRRLIQFMQPGTLQTIKFKFTGKSLEAVLDRLPTAEVLEENNGEYIIRAKIFGKGIKMWLLSQGESIEVLEPRDFREDMKTSIQKMLAKY